MSVYLVVPINRRVVRGAGSFSSLQQTRLVRICAKKCHALCVTRCVSRVVFCFIFISCELMVLKQKKDCCEVEVILISRIKQVFFAIKFINNQDNDRDQSTFGPTNLHD